MSKPVEIEFLLKNRTKSGMAEMETGLDSMQQDASNTQAIIATLREEMQRLQQQVAAMPALDQSENIAMIEALQAKIEELESDLARISKTAKSASASAKNTTLVPKDAAKAQSTFSGLNMSIQQIAREMPSLAMGPQMFFLAISNNLPIFADNVQRAREEYDMLVKSGQKAVPVWKQILKSLFSWQTGLTTGIMLLVMYGKEVGNWVSELVGGKSALDEMRESMAQTYELEKKAQETAARTRFELMSVIASIKEFNGTKDAERQKIDELNSKYGETFGYYQTLSEWYDTLSAKAEQYTQLLFLQTKQQSLVDKALEADDKVNKIQNTPWQDYNTWWGYGGRIDRFFSDNERYKNSPNGQWLKEEALAEAKAERDDYLRQAEELRKEAQGIVDSTGLTDVVAGSVQDLENTIAAKRKALKDLTNKADYDAALAEIKVYEDKLNAITGGGKKTTKSGGGSGKSNEQSLEKLSDMELAARQRVEEQVVELMKDGYDKQRAEAELNFRKEKQRIEKEEQERLALYDKLKKSGAKVSPGDRMTITAQAATQRVQAAQLLDNQLAEIDKKEEEENRKKLEKLLGQYQDYAAQREAIERKHNTAIESLRSQLSSSRLEALGKQMTGQFSGNVDLLARPVIDAAKLAEKGWKDAGEGIATVFSSQFGIEDASGKQREILVTPILPDGTVLSEAELTSYIDNTLSGAEDILKADTMGIVIAVDVDPDGSAGEKLHQLQDAYYSLKQDAESNVVSDNAINRAIQVAEATKQKDLSKVDAAEASEAFKDNDFLKRLFGDYSSMSFSSLQNLISQAKQLRDYLSGNGTAKGITFISPEDLSNIEKSPADLDRLRKALDKLLKAGSGSSSNKWEGIFRTFESGLAKLKGAKDFEDISDAMGSIGEAATSATGEIAKMFEEMGDTQTAEAVSGAQQVLGAVSNIGQGFAKGGIVGGIAAAVGEAANFIGQAFAAEARHQEALKEIERAKLDFQRQYNLALIEQNLLLQEATNVFGERQIEKAMNAIEVYRKALSDLKQELAGSAVRGLEYALISGTWYDQLFGGVFTQAKNAYKKGLGGLWEAQIVTGHEKTGLFGWGKGRDVYSSILSVYPELIDANGELDTAMLQTILDTRKMSDDTRKYLENLIDLKDAMDEAEEALEDYLQQTFGSLGDGILDSITTALAEGGSALENFADEAASVLENLGEQIAYSLFFADKFDDLESQLKDVYGGEGSPEDIANEAMEVIGDFYDGIGSDMSAAQAWLEAWREKAEEMGFDLWQGGTSQSGKAGAFTTMTQDQGTKLEGLFTSGQMHWASIDEKMDNAVSGLGGCLDVLGRIAANTNALPLMLALLQSVQRDGLKMK